jgi:hypothetical protein
MASPPPSKGGESVFAPAQATTVFKSVHVHAMTPAMAEAVIKRAAADAAIANATHATPARQESVRVGLVALAVIALPIIGQVFNIDRAVILAGMAVVAGIYGVPKTIEKIREPKELLPPK